MIHFTDKELDLLDILCKRHMRMLNTPNSVPNDIIAKIHDERYSRQPREGDKLYRAAQTPHRDCTCWKKRDVCSDDEYCPDLVNARETVAEAQQRRENYTCTVCGVKLQFQYRHQKAGDILIEAWKNEALQNKPTNPLTTNVNKRTYILGDSFTGTLFDWNETIDIAETQKFFVNGVGPTTT